MKTSNLLRARGEQNNIGVTKERYRKLPRSDGVKCKQSTVDENCDSEFPGKFSTTLRQRTKRSEETRTHDFSALLVPCLSAVEHFIPAYVRCCWRKPCSGSIGTARSRTSTLPLLIARDPGGVVRTRCRCRRHRISDGPTNMGGRDREWDAAAENITLQPPFRRGRSTTEEEEKEEEWDGSILNINFSARQRFRVQHCYTRCKYIYIYIY